MLWDVFQWFVSLVEVASVLAAILAAGVAIAMAAFWILSWGLGKFAGASVDQDPGEYEMDDSLPASNQVFALHHAARIRPCSDMFEPDVMGEGPEQENPTSEQHWYAR